MRATKKQSLESLPSDPEKLKLIIMKLSSRVAALEEYVLLGRANKYGASSEKSVDQREMFNEAELSVVAESVLVEQTAAREAQSNTIADKPKNKAGRKPLPGSLPRIRIEHRIPAAEQVCGCGCQRVEIGEVTSEQLDIIPAKVQVIVNVRKKYACQHCESGVITAPLPAQPIPKSNASPGMLAHVAIAKYQDGLPLHRQETVLSRSGVEIPRNTLANWMIKSGELTQPLINLLDDKLIAYPIMHCDETTLQVLKEPDKQASQKSYMWVRVGGPPTQPVRLFHYADSRRGEVVSALLAGYNGYLQTDDYAGYNAVCAENTITQLGCWAHARRKFIDAQKAATGKTGRAGKADVAVRLIAKLYAIEKRIKPLSPTKKHAARQTESLPILADIRQWLDKTLHHTLPKGLLGKALSYLTKNWKKLTIYTEDGRLSIDNNPAENAIRPFVIGRKNWLFSASVRGAKSSANLYGLIETAKANGLEPYAYLRHVFKALPLADNVEEVEALLPWNVSLESAAIK
ncbi:MAG: IS66 family transposase [Thiotrichaceae bacterium]|nr:IS66 family transposase [Thiotrichaceae bacterium]MBL1261935.1 IS66 family transposase [Thiotrichaceae bacterium]